VVHLEGGVALHLRVKTAAAGRGGAGAVVVTELEQQEGTY
jgi:hypothetical protein